MSEYERFKRWNRASPWIGAVGAVMYAAFNRVVGPTGPDDWLWRLLPTDAVFGVSPAVGYLTFLLFGFALGWVVRAFEDRFVWPDE